MTPDGHDPFVDLLAAYENALLAGDKAPPLPPTAAVKARLDDALACVQMLRQMWPAAAPSDAAKERQRGERYELLRLHATGGIGRVWLAEDNNLGREVALKELKADRAGDALLARRFLHEARITSRLQHPGVAPVYELAAGQGEQAPFYTMRFVRGRTLGEAIADYHTRRKAGRAGPLELPGLLRALVSVCHTVAYAHSQAIVHRDLKTANVVLGDFGEAVVLDWGFACELDEPADDGGAATVASADPQHTLVGQVVGTPGYMAPEQAAGRRDLISRQTDVYGLGAILFEILTGQPPFAGSETAELIRQARDAEPPAPEALCPSAPKALAAVCRKALAREPAARFATAGELAQEVERWLADECPRAFVEPVWQRLGRWGRRHRPLVAALAVSGVLSLLGLTLLEREQARTAEVRAGAAAERAATESSARDALEAQLYHERIARAERELAAHNLARATQLLHECPPERRGWEWHCLQRLCFSDPLVVRGHDAPVSGAVFCLDGQRLVSAGHDHTIRLWNARTGNLEKQTAGHKDVIHCLAASPDGKLFATGSWDRSVTVWDAATGRLLATLPNHPGIVIRVAFFPDGRRLVSHSNQRITIWNLATQQIERSIEETRGQIFGLAVSPDGRLLATGTGDDRIILRDLESGAVLRTITGHRAAVKHLAFSPDSRLLAAGDGDTLQGGPGAVRLWHVASGAEHACLLGHTDPIFAVAFSPDGRRVVSGGQDNVIKVWDVDARRETLTLRGHADVVRSLAFSPDGARLLSASADRTLRVWDAGQGSGTPDAQLQVFRGHVGQVLGVGVATDGTILSLGYDQSLKRWDVEQGKELASAVADPKMQCHSFAISRQGRVALGSSSGAVVLADSATAKKNGMLLGFGAGPVKGVAFSGDGQRLATAEWRHEVRIWDLASGKPAHVLRGHAEPVVAVAFDASGALLASGSHDQTAKLWDARTGLELRTLQGHASQLTAVALAPDGKTLASAANDGMVKLWDAESGKELHTLRAHTGAVGGLAFSPDGKLLASASDDWTVKLWDVAAGALARTYRGHSGAVRCAAFDAERQSLLSGGQDGAVRRWQLP